MSASDDALERLKRASEQSAKWQAEKKKAVLAALVAGWSVRQITATTGLSSATVVKWKEDAGIVFEAGSYRMP